MPKVLKKKSVKKYSPYQTRSLSNVTSVDDTDSNITYKLRPRNLIDYSLQDLDGSDDDTNSSCSEEDSEIGEILNGAFLLIPFDTLEKKGKSNYSVDSDFQYESDDEKVLLWEKKVI